MKHYSFQNGIGIGVGILSSINRENLTKNIINENKKINNKTIENEISEKNKIYPIKNNVIYPPSSRNNLKHNTKNVINKNLNNEKIDLKRYSAQSTTQNSTLSSYNNTHSNESKENNDEIYKKINFDIDKNMNNKNNLNSLINKIAIPDFIQNKKMNKSIFFHKQNIHTDVVCKQVGLTKCVFYQRHLERLNDITRQECLAASRSVWGEDPIGDGEPPVLS